MRVTEARRCLKQRRTKDLEIRCQPTLRQLGKEQTSMSTGGFPTTARFATARRNKEAFSGLAFVSLGEYSVAVEDTTKKKKRPLLYKVCAFVCLCVTYIL